MSEAVREIVPLGAATPLPESTANLVQDIMYSDTTRDAGLLGLGVVRSRSLLYEGEIPVGHTVEQIDLLMATAEPTFDVTRLNSHLRFLMHRVGKERLAAFSPYHFREANSLLELGHLTFADKLGTLMVSRSVLLDRPISEHGKITWKKQEVYDLKSEVSVLLFPDLKTWTRQTNDGAFSPLRSKPYFQVGWRRARELRKSQSH